MVNNGKRKIQAAIWDKCPRCHRIIYSKQLSENNYICPGCSHYFRLNCWQRLELLCERESFREFFSDIKTVDPLKFYDTISYPDRIKRNRKKTGLNEAVITGTARIGKQKVAIGIMDFRFMGGSMGSAVGEKITSLIELAVKKRLPLIICSTSGGARMHEGIISLMQMAKTSAALARLSEENLPYISVMTDPTTGGVTASFAMLGDINIAEPGALIGFAGPRVIEKTIKQQLPDGFQRAEFLKERGMVDIVVPRAELKDTIIKLLGFLVKK